MPSRISKEKITKNIRLKLCILILGLLTTGIMITLICVLTLRSGASPSTEAYPAQNPEYGSIQLENQSTKSREEIMQMLNEEVEKGMFHLFINTDVSVGEDQRANLLIQNIPNNHDACIVEIYDQQTNALYYQSQLIQPGYKVEYDRLAVTPSPGSYPCIARFLIIDPDSLNQKNVIGVHITITV